jgi:hypothetical protein
VSSPIHLQGRHLAGRWLALGHIQGTMQEEAWGRLDFASLFFDECGHFLLTNFFCMSK